MSFLRYYLWIGPHFFLCLFLWVFLRRGLHKQFPFFLAYVLFELVYFLASCVATVLPGSDSRQHLHIYKWIVVWGMGISALISFGVIYELVNKVVLSRSTLAQTLGPMLRWSAAALLLVTAAISGRLAIAGVESAMNVFQVLDFSSSMLQVGLLVLLFLFSRVLRVSWRSLAAGIALGLGVLGSVELSAAGLLSVLGPRHYVAIDMTRLAGFQVCVLVWLGYLLFPDRGPTFVGKPPQESELDSWNQEMQKIVRR